ncbi:MAG: carboxypeptidase regulatory-like domain-containing protein [Planctomycetes bacterium]|nr:carboxypeptidase regulatory-like domain-containing protein [Planctomycetota bacterium]
MKRLLALLLVGLVVLLVWIASDGASSESVGSTREPASIAAAPVPSRLEAPEPLSVAPDAAPARESAERVEIAPLAADAPARLTLLGVVRDARGRAIENFGIRGIRKDASNAFAEERVWDVAFHAGGEFALVDLEPHAWELAPFADGYRLERSERFVRSNARAVVFRMKSQVEISGVVLDSMDLPIAGAKVRAEEQSARDDFPESWEATSDRAGRFQLTLDVGEYVLRATCGGYADGEEQRIEVEHLRAQRNVELRLADGCSVRIVFNRAVLGTNVPTNVLAMPLQGGGAAQSVSVGPDANDATVRGLAPGWTRLFLASGFPPDKAYTAAVELQLGPTLDVSFEPRLSVPVAVRLRSPQPGAEAFDFQREYELLPTLPNLNWLALSRERPSEARDSSQSRWSSLGEQIAPAPSDSLWISANEWNAPAPGSYVALPRRRSRLGVASPVRFEAPHAPSFELELGPPATDSRAGR